MARIAVKKTYKLYIGGAFPRTESGRYYQVIDTNGDFVANICRASRKDFRNSVKAARKAQESWAARTAFNRGQILYRMAEMLESRRAMFETMLLEHAGQSKKDAKVEVSAAIDRIVWYAGWSDKFAQVFGAVNPVAGPYFNFTTPAATGVVAVVTPESNPLLGLVSSIIPVLVGGNTCVAVVESQCPQIAIEFAEVLATSDLPGGVINILTGYRSELLPHVGTHMDVDAVSAFGLSQDERRELELAGAESVKRVKVEPDLGKGWLIDSGQSPYRIMPFVEFKTAWHPIGR
ncbi:MAG: acyl-CoA reductase-like NAD-dependent aldehyde dehydrogenase [Bradymonadia bacterium]